MVKKSLWPASAALLAVAALAGCEANGGASGLNNGGGGGDTTNNGNVDAFPNDPLGPGGDSVDGLIVEQQDDGSGNLTDEQIAYGDSGFRFFCAGSNGVESTEASANGLVGEVVAGALLDSLGGESVTALTNSIQDLPFAIDNQMDTASTYTLTASALEVLGPTLAMLDPSIGGIDTLDQIIYFSSNKTDYAVAAISFPAGLADVSLTLTVTISTFLDEGDTVSTEPTEPPVEFGGMAVDLLGMGGTGPGFILVGRKVTEPYNRMVVSLSGDVLAANVGEAMFFHDACTSGSLVEVPAAQ